MGALSEEFNKDWLKFKSSPESSISVRSQGSITDDGERVFPMWELDQLDLNFPIHKDLLHEWHKANGEIHRVDGPAIIIRDPENSEKPLYEGWYLNGKLHREDGPAVTRRKGGYMELEWWQDDKRHREDGPAELWIEASGTERFSRWYRQDVEHRDDGPSTVWIDDETGIVSEEEWMVNGLLHRLDGPAEVLRNSVTGQTIKEAWYRNGELFRENGPALISCDHQTGKIHAADSYFRHGKAVTQPSGLSYNITPTGP